MIYTKRFVWIIFTTILLASINVAANAQVALLQQTIDKLESYKSFSYQRVYKQKDEYADTLITNEGYTLFKAPEAKETGYFVRMEDKDTTMKTVNINLYNGQDVFELNPADSTYNTGGSTAMLLYKSVLGGLNLMRKFAIKTPSKLVQLSDTAFNSINCYHLMLTTQDTIINKDHLYAKIHLLIDKTSGLPVDKFIKARTNSLGKEVENYYTEDSYFNYKIDDDNINAASFNLPREYRPAKEEPEEQTALLAPGTLAPGFTLYDSDGKATSLAQLKGKIVMLDFFYVGCGPCLNSLATLDRLYEKYKGKDLVILSISDRDSKKLVTTFKKTERIKNQMFPAAADVAKAYHIISAPTFYIIDKDGRIASVDSGFEEDSSEKKMTTVIDGLLKK